MPATMCLCHSIERMSSGEVYGAQDCDDGADGTFKLIRIYYHRKGTPEFWKTIFYADGIVLSLLIKYLWLGQRKAGTVPPVRLVRISPDHFAKLYCKEH